MPATDFQSWSASFGYMKSRGFINYLFLDMATPLDPNRMEQACQTVVAEHPIVRTTFVADVSNIFQVVLKNYPIQFQHIEQDDPIEKTWRQLIDTDTKTPVSFGQNFLKFFLLSQHQNKQRLVIRISHPQYDGISFPSIYQTLNKAYQGSQLKPHPPFTTFIGRTTNTSSIVKAESSWRHLLQNSTTTSLTPTSYAPSYRHPLDQTVGRTIPLPAPNLSNFTLATLVKASWSLLLSSLSSTTDIIFGDLTSGRSLPMPSIHEIVGPCLNIIPVRVSLNSIHTVRDLLNHIQDQHISSLPFENLGFRRIIKNCTNWPRYARLSSVVQHQNIPELSGKVKIGGVQCATGAVRGAADTSDVVVLSRPGEGGSKIEIGYSSQGELSACADDMLEELCGVIQALASDLDASLPQLEMPPSLSGLFAPVSHSPTPTANPSLPTENSSEHSAATALQSSEALKVQNLWREVLPVPSLLTNQAIHPETSFFEVGGDTVSAVLLAAAFKRNGYDVSAEDVVDFPSLGAQVGLLVSRRGKEMVGE
jgi:aryl carrier-like protein